MPPAADIAAEHPPIRTTIGKRDARGVIRHGGEWLAIWADPASVASPEERLALAAQRREREARGRALGATLRAIAGRPSREVPALPPQPSREEWTAARGEADDAGLRLRHHDPALHARLAPAEPRRRALFDALERARWQALGIARMPGIEDNLAAVLARRLDRLGLRHAHLAAQVPLAEALPMLALDALLGHDAPLLDTGAMEMWHRFAQAHFAAPLLALRPLVADQTAYAAAAETAIAAMFSAMDWDDAKAPPTLRRPDALPAPAGETADTAEGQQEGAVEEAGAGPTLPTSGRPSTGYVRFTTAHDLVTDAAALANPAELAVLRDQLDAAMGDARAVLARLAQRLQRRLLAEAVGSWSFDHEEGILDAGRLDRVVVRPGAALAFKQEHVAAARDTVVALLIDHSGSMRGRPITIAAIAADLAAQALERCGVAVEILGFSTRGWRGGHSARDWQAAGRPAHPGRLCDLLHVVFKSAATPYRHARASLALMLREDLLRENVDGEALQWATSRLLARPERRRLLLVISDGAPNDRATLDANDTLYLDRHLRDVVATMQAHRRIELSAIGLRHPVDRVYRDAVVVDSPDQLGTALLSQLGRRLLRR